MAFDELLASRHDIPNVPTVGQGTEEAWVMARLKSGMHETRGHAKEIPDETLSLTARQTEVLHLVALGHTNREIGGQLGISVRTVEIHRFNLMRRLRVQNVAQLLRQGMLLQLIPKQPPPPE
ncbi:MAG: helix-turn-helix transcriptional regulator [Nitrospira sp.]|nr:helix-turn-helix transcriptional regulator [Nitrospira sp.]MDD9859657.1 helix-turn-helix transcriptional regulator [Nitrospira sp.]